MRIHIIGICGIGMSAIAQILHSMGYVVQGSDLSTDCYMFEKLRNIGVRVINNHSKHNIDNVDLVIKSTAIRDNNEEVVRSKALGKEVLTRTQALKMLLINKTVIAVSGAHGKSTSTAMIYSMLDRASLNPSLLCGALVNGIDNNAVFGKSNIFVLEADESDGTFSKIYYFCGLLTNIDYEHMDYYGDFENLLCNYSLFIQNVDPTGVVAVCKDDKNLSLLVDSLSDDKIFMYYGVNSENLDVRATNICFYDFKSRFDVEFSRKLRYLRPMRNIEVNLPGLHNVYNALGSISIAIKLGIAEEDIRFALSKFLGLKRRFTVLGKVNGATIVDDYGHHPTEIIRTIEAANNIVESANHVGRVICVIQPHRFSRVKALFDQYVNLFNKVYYTFIIDVCSAGEEAIENCYSVDIVKIAKEKGIDNVEFVKSEENINDMLLTKISEGDMVIFFGAGNITNLANNFFTSHAS